MIEPFTKCSNLSRSLEFYTAILDFAVKVAPNPDPTSFDSKHAILERGGCLLHLSSHEGDGAFGSKVYVRVSDIDGLYKQCVSNGLNTSNRDSPPALRGGPVEQTWGMKEFWVHDPDGNNVTFGQPLQ